MARLRTLAALALGLGALGCSSSYPGAPASPSAVTYHKDIAPLLAEHCLTCHAAGGLAPMRLETYDDVLFHRDAIAKAVATRVMPPWPPGAGCTGYLGDRSLTDAEIETVQAWARTGGPEGIPGDGPAPQASAAGKLSRVDLSLATPAAYQPQLAPDEYRCFVVDWPQTTTKFITGLTVRPGNPKIVHHVIAFVAPPASAAQYAALAAGDGGGQPGYSCFGGPGGDNSAGWVGAWAPGTLTADFPAGTGIEVAPGSKVVLQVHYNLLNGLGQTDQTQVDLKLDDAVQKRAFVLPWASLDWVNHQHMPIPAGQADVQHAWQYDPTPVMNYITDVIPPNQPFTLYSAGAHMHLRGKSERLEIVHADGGSTCLLDVPDWDFHWQGGYAFSEPKVFHPGDQLKISCHWDNSARNQPWVGGVQEAPRDLNWGEGTHDEMCLGIFYITP